MGFAVKKSNVHPYTTRKKGVCGGRSIIEGTRIPVWSIIKWYKLGMSIEDIMREFPQLTPSQVHDAFSYYYDNQKEIEGDIVGNKDEVLIGNKIEDVIKIALGNMDKAYCELSRISYSKKSDLKKEQPTEDKYLERPFAYEFYHQVRKLIDMRKVHLGVKTVIQAEVDKKYQHYFEAGKIPDFIIHIPNSNSRNLAVIEFKLASNLNKIEADLKKLIEFKKNGVLKYNYIIEVIIGNRTSIEKARIKIEHLGKSQGEKITILEFNTDRWTSNSIEISYS